MIDTGATHTCIDETAARRAGLPIKGSASMHSASHAGTKVPIFAGQIEAQGLRINVESALGANLTHFPGGQLVALIGRDVLKKMVFTYDGPKGTITASV